MSLTTDVMQRLMAYADGELDPAEQGEVEALLAREEDAARFVAQLRGLGDLVRVGHEDRHAGALAAFDVTDAVMAKVKDAEPDLEVSRPSADIVSLNALRARRAQRFKIGATIVAAFAAAAAFVLVTRGPSEAPVAEAPTPAAPAAPATPTAPTEAPGVGALARSALGVEVDAIESAGHSVSVFYLPGASALTTSVVVWVEETGEQ